MNILKLLLVIALSATLFGCSKPSSSNGVAASQLPVQARKVVAVVSRNQLLPNYIACTGLPADAVSNDTRNEAQRALAKMAEEGDVDKISAPMMMAFVKVGAEICNDLIRHEQNAEERKFFKGFNLNRNNDEGTADLDGTVRTLASSCWGRQPTTTEVNQIRSSVTATSFGDNTDQNTALYVCTAILASSSAVKF